MGSYYTTPETPERRNSFDERLKDINQHDIEQAERAYRAQLQENRDPAVSYRLPQEPAQNYGINGWDDSANRTINNWYDTCRLYRWRYQFILDRNYNFASRLNTASVVFSSVLSIFSGFKLWKNDLSFQNASNIVMLISNTCIAGITTLSKKYIDDSRNEKIRNYIENIDKFIGIVHSQAMIAPNYRLHSHDFINSNIETYTQLMTTCPNMSIAEYALAKQEYQIFLEKMGHTTTVKN